jgi:hypothetical protein
MTKAPQHDGMAAGDIEVVGKAVEKAIWTDNQVYWSMERGDPFPKTTRDALARAAIEALRQPASPEQIAEGEGWQPIETAPKDGTKFDAWVPDAFGGRRMTELSFNWRGQLRQHGLLSAADLPRWPTHWRPLPSPPTNESAGQ